MPSLLDSAPKVLGLAAKAIDQWLDAPDDRQSHPLFVVGCQRSGTTMLIDVLRQAPQVWVYPEKNPVAFDDFRLRSPATIEALLWLTPADHVVFKPICDTHLTDRLLDAHEGSKALWLVRSWADVARSAVAKWGDHQLEIVRSIARGQVADLGWRGERLPAALVDQLADLVDDQTTPHTGAALFWYVRNSFFFALGLHDDPRVRLLSYADLVDDPATGFAEVFAFGGIPFDPAWVAHIEDRSRSQALPEVPDEVAALCDALQRRLDTARAEQARR